MTGTPARIRLGPAVRVSSRVDYALRAVTALARAGTPLTASRIARENGISVKFLYDILAQLHRAGLVRSRRGTGGGHWLTRPAGHITAGDVVNAVCHFPPAGHPDPDADTVVPSESRARDPVGRVWLALQTSVTALLDGVTIADLVDDARRAGDAPTARTAARAGDAAVRTAPAAPRGTALPDERQ